MALRKYALVTPAEIPNPAQPPPSGRSSISYAKPKNRFKYACLGFEFVFCCRSWRLTCSLGLATRMGMYLPASYVWIPARTLWYHTRHQVLSFFLTFLFVSCGGQSCSQCFPTGPLCHTIALLSRWMTWSLNLTCIGYHWISNLENIFFCRRIDFILKKPAQMSDRFWFYDQCNCPIDFRSLCVFQSKSWVIVRPNICTCRYSALATSYPDTNTCWPPTAVTGDEDRSRVGCSYTRNLPSFFLTISLLYRTPLSTNGGGVLIFIFSIVYAGQFSTGHASLPFQDGAPFLLLI